MQPPRPRACPLEAGSDAGLCRKPGEVPGVNVPDALLRAETPDCGPDTQEERASACSFGLARSLPVGRSRTHSGLEPAPWVRKQQPRHHRGLGPRACPHHCPPLLERALKHRPLSRVNTDQRVQTTESRRPKQQILQGEPRSRVSNQGILYLYKVLNWADGKATGPFSQRSGADFGPRPRALPPLYPSSSCANQTTTQHLWEGSAQPTLSPPTPLERQA